MAKALYTKKRKELVVLPGQTVLYQSNRITNGQYKGFTLVQSKIFVSVIKCLQDAIKLNMNNQDVQQLVLFKENSDLISLKVKMSSIGNADSYDDILQAAKDLMKITVHLKSEKGDNYFSIATLFSKVECPTSYYGDKHLYLHMYKEVAHKLIEVQKTLGDKPMQYTSYYYEVAMQARSKFTFKMYWLISSWKTKGGFFITLDELKSQLGIEETEYTVYKDFKKRVLMPVQKDLEKKADCWFNCSSNDFEVRSGKKIVRLNFKIITPEFENINNAKIQHIKHILSVHAHLSIEQLNRLSPIFINKTDYTPILEKIIYLVQYISKPEQKITDPQEYLIAALLNEFSHQ